MKDTGSKLGFLLIGAAVGAAVGYVIASDKKEQWMGDIKYLVDKVKGNAKCAARAVEEELDEIDGE